MRAVLASSFVLAVATPGLAWAQAPAATDKTYVTAKMGAVVPSHDDLDGFDNGLAVEGAVGYRASENLALEFSVGRFSMTGSFTGVSSTGVVYTETDEVIAYPVTASVKTIIPIDKVQLYGLLGGGLYFISVKAEAEAPGYVPVTDSDSASPFGLLLGGGFSIRLSDRAFAGAEVKYVIGSAKIWDETNNFDSVLIGGMLTFSL